MNNNKGFTLIELIVTITIIGLIGLIAIPSTKSLIDKSKEKAQNTQNKIILKAAEEYSINNTNQLPTIDSVKYKIDIETLINEQHLEEDKMDLDIIKKEGQCVIVTFDSNRKKYNFELQNNCLDSYPSPPKLQEGMIPVTIENNGTVKKANLDKWYAYEKRQWANAVLVTESSRNGYTQAAAESIINPTDIIGYFVWIPRYKYKIPKGGTYSPSSIDIHFENKETEKSIGDAKINYFTHPGFKFDNEELDGFWAAKFETTGTASIPTVLPNITSLRSQNVNNQFLTALKFNDYSSSSNAHMMKDTEWAAVAYLSHSKYGLNYEVRINNNSGYITGCGANEKDAASSSACQIAYGNGYSYFPQSTTGNITGVFDMSGGSWERVMGNYNNSLAVSGFASMPDQKYYNLYQPTSFANACDGAYCLGHANIETKYWYSDPCGDLSSGGAWVSRSGYHASTTGAGLFATSGSNGNSLISGSFRVTLG